MGLCLINCSVPSPHFFFLNFQWYVNMFIYLICQKVSVQCAQMYHPGKESKILKLCFVGIYSCDGQNASSISSHSGAQPDLTLSLPTSKVSGGGSWEHSLLPHKVVVSSSKAFYKLVGSWGSLMSSVHRKQYLKDRYIWVDSSGTPVGLLFVE